jgi:GrpB-like predicted nucleotidyltransferase (UPF0157 family)
VTGGIRQDKIRIVAYDASWPGLFEQQRSRLAEVLEPWLIGPIEHLGSTAVPGLAAKPIIDMLARVDDFEALDIIPAMRSIGWVHAPEPADAEQRRWSFCYPSIELRSHHLHVVEQRSAGWPTWLAFRDHLRSHPELAREYGRIKAELADLDCDDRPAYRAGKAPFIEAVLASITWSAP